MKNLARHIELLLRDNDCVILPGFGGFVSHGIPAYYVDEEGLYYPPSRSVCFNAAITMNDGLLAQSYMTRHQVDYAHANYMIDVAIEQLIDTLDEKGYATLPRIGTITKDIHHSLQFIPEEAGINSPTHFGLSSFSIKELSQLHGSAEGSRNHQDIITPSKKTIDLHINKDALQRIISTAAIVLLLMMISLPIGNNHPTNIASLHLAEIIATPQLQTFETVPNTTVTATTDNNALVSATPSLKEEYAPIELATEHKTITEESITTTVEHIDVITEVPQPTTFETKPTKTYHIIVASLPNYRGANETLAQYINLGYDNASIVERDDRVRISLAQFTDKNEANEYLKTLRQNDKFQNAWLLAVRNN